MSDIKGIKVVNNYQFDKFDLIVRIHRFFGLNYYFYNKFINKFILLFLILNQLLICGLILNICSPCLLHDFNCGRKHVMTASDYRQMVIFMISRDLMAIISSIIYSIRGKQFRKIINDLRNYFSK